VTSWNGQDDPTSAATGSCCPGSPRKDAVPATKHAVELTQVAARAASDKLARDIVAFDVSDRLAIADAFLLCSAPNERQVAAIVDEIRDRLAAVGAKNPRVEGERDARWVLLDYGELVIHVQHTEEREYYSLERLWRDCPEIPLPEEVTHAGPVNDQLERRTGTDL
jgi:ribosome-associated protein